jgi:hypothetical protein
MKAYFNKAHLRTHDERVFKGLVMKPVVVVVSVVAVVYLVLALAMVDGWISIPEKSCDRGDILFKAKTRRIHECVGGKWTEATGPYTEGAQLK